MRRLVNFEILDGSGNLCVTLTEDGKEELEDLLIKRGKNGVSIDDCLHELFEYYTCNGWSWVDGAMTDMPMVSDEFEYLFDLDIPEHKEVLANSERQEDEKIFYTIWGYEDYMIKDELEVLNHEGKIVFTKFDNTEKDYGIFVYSRKAENDSKPPIDMTYCGDEEDAKLMFYKRAYDFDKKEWWVELWKADEEGTYGVSGEPILTSYTDKV